LYFYFHDKEIVFVAGAEKTSELAEDSQTAPPYKKKKKSNSISFKKLGR